MVEDDGEQGELAVEVAASPRGKLDTVVLGVDLVAVDLVGLIAWL